MLNSKKNIFLTIGICVSFLAVGCDSLTKSSAVSESKINVNTAVPQTTSSAANNAALLSAATPTANKNAAANVKKPTTDEPLPRKIDDDTAESPVYKIDSKNCQKLDDYGSDGDEFERKCKGYGNYSLWASGFDDQINYRIESNGAKSEFVAYLAPLEAGDADEYRRADRFVQKLGDKIQWILDEKGKPYAIFVHAYFYKNTGKAKSSVNPKNKVAEFVLLRGLDGWKEIDSDIETKDVAYNPDEWARKIAVEVREEQKN